ncbi:hypothetical protein Tco_0914920 [Tanacetum coccineum]
MTTLAKHMIVVGAENRPPMLDKLMYNSWQSRMLIYIKGKNNELIEQQKLQDDCDVQAIKIIPSRGEGYGMQCTKHKRPRNSAWFKGKDVVGSGTRIWSGIVDAYDFDCDDISSAKVVLMANLSSYDSDVLSESEQLVVIQTLVEIEVPKELPKCSVDKKYFDIQKKELSLDNDRILDHIICQDVTNIVMHDNFVPVNVLSANHICLVDGNLESEWLKQENDHLFELLLSQDIVHIYVNSLAIVTNYAKMEQDYNDEYSENLVLKAELAKKE